MIITEAVKSSLWDADLAAYFCEQGSDWEAEKLKGHHSSMNPASFVLSHFSDLHRYVAALLILGQMSRIKCRRLAL